MTQFKEVPEFAKDVEKLHRKYHHFKEDFERFKKALDASLPTILEGLFVLPVWGTPSKHRYTR